MSTALTRPSSARRSEIRELLRREPAEVLCEAGEHLEVFEDLDGIHARIACEMAEFIEGQNARDEPTRFILPVGPVGQYPLFLEHVRDREISLKRCHFFFMDEYADESGRALPMDHPLSFAGEMKSMWLEALPAELAVPPRQVFFPSEANVESLAGRIADLGGIDICFGGIGVHGHLAFNEPEAGVVDSGPRLVELNDYTVTINAVRAHVGGNLEGFPRRAFTLGLRQILGARHIRLACRNGIPLDWANTVLRLTLFGKPGEDYPCTFVHTHPDYRIFTDTDTLRSPENVL